MCHHGAELQPIRLRTEPFEAREMVALGVYWCTLCQQERPLDEFIFDGVRGLPRSRCRYCSGIATRAAKHNRKFSEIYLLFEYQNRSCYLCNEPHSNDRGLNLDHWHDCCPNKGESKGRCIRGLLCWLCNGGFVAAYERMRGRVDPYPLLEEYLANPPALQLGLVLPGERCTTS
ncbi:hypothetical protein B1L11_44685 [Microbispora sp. GKU 823]|nr:hypothetical protein B1L11_44685 [Microbispora sp. GKU 823]